MKRRKTCGNCKYLEKENRSKNFLGWCLEWVKYPKFVNRKKDGCEKWKPRKKGVGKC